MKKLTIMVFCLSILVFPAYTAFESASANIYIGTLLYTRDGKYFGKVVDVTENDMTFENGTRDKGVLIDLGTEKPFWMKRTWVTTNLYVQTSDPVQKENEPSCACLNMIGLLAITCLVIFIPYLLYRNMKRRDE